MIGKQRKAQKYFLVRKVHLEPGAFRLMPAEVQSLLSSPWEASIRLVNNLAPLPDEALIWWADQPVGHLVLSAGNEGYRRRYVLGDGESLEGVSKISISRVVNEPRNTLIRSLFPLDHLLGANGSDGPWLSDGAGISQRWHEIGQRIQQLFVLGYGLTHLEQTDAHHYFASGLADAMLLNPTVNRNDPKLLRLFQDSILSAGFWKGSLKSE